MNPGMNTEPWRPSSQICSSSAARHSPSPNIRSLASTRLRSLEIAFKSVAVVLTVLRVPTARILPETRPPFFQDSTAGTRIVTPNDRVVDSSDRLAV